MTLYPLLKLFCRSSLPCLVLLYLHCKRIWVFLPLDLIHKSSFLLQSDPQAHITAVVSTCDISQWPLLIPAALIKLQLEVTAPSRRWPENNNLKPVLNGPEPVQAHEEISLRLSLTLGHLLQSRVICGLSTPPKALPSQGLSHV